VRLPSMLALVEKIYAIMPRFPVMAERTPVELVYDGEQVKDGSVPVEYMIDALVGFTSAYSKIARRTEGADLTHHIRVVGLRPNSTHILVDIVEWVKGNPAAATVLLSGGTGLVVGAYKVIKDIAAVFTGKKHLAGAPVHNHFHIRDSNIYLVNELKQELPFTKQQLEYLQSGLIDADLDKLTAPLEDENVNKFELKSGTKPLAEANRSDRQYFSTSPKPVTTTRDDVWLEGTLNSLTKDKKRGTFYTLSGKHIPYQFVGIDEKQLLDAFTYPGVVRARGKVGFDSGLEPTQIQIVEIRPAQGGLNIPPAGEA
jgi:hypothetical protein